LNIAENTVPFSTESVRSVAPARGVLEINGGLSEKLGIAPGDTVRHPFFGTASQTPSEDAAKTAGTHD
jgi:uncharacterized membrane protein (UPF0127 family)